MKKTNLKEKLQNWKLGNYFRELSIVTAGVFILSLIHISEPTRH